MFPFKKINVRFFKFAFEIQILTKSSKLQQLTNYRYCFVKNIYNYTFSYLRFKNVLECHSHLISHRCLCKVILTQNLIKIILGIYNVLKIAFIIIIMKY